MYIDSHTHFDLILEHKKANENEIIDDLIKNNIGHSVQVAIDANNLKWSYEFSKKYGFLERDNIIPEDIGTYVPFAQIDSDLVHVNQMLKFIKFGFGQCMDHVCYDLRDGLIDRKTAIELVLKYDGKCSRR